MIPCPECGVLYGTKHTADCPIRARNWDKLKSAMKRGKITMKTPRNHEWPDFLQNETPEAPKEKRKKVYGVAVNDAPYKVDEIIDGKRITCHYYNTWKNMLNRCYGNNGKNKSYVGCSVVDGWLVFSVFREWMRLQDYEGKSLDKDLIMPGNKVYCPEFCAFVSTKLNNYLVKPKKEGKHKLGTSKHTNGWWYAKCRLWDGTNYSKCHKTEREANVDYVRVKSAEIEKIILEVDDKLGEGLTKHVYMLNASLPDNPEKAKRHNDGKPELSYLLDFPVAISGLARVMTYGATKYGKSNWQLGGLTEDEYIDCALRHLTAYKKGETFDKETKENHLFHFAVNAMMLAEMHGREKVSSPDRDDVAAAYAMMAATIVTDTGRGPVDDISLVHGKGAGATVAGTVSTAEDEPPLEPTLFVSDGSTVMDAKIVVKKATRLAATIGTDPADVINEYAMMFFNDSAERDKFYGRCMALICNDDDPLGR